VHRADNLTIFVCRVSINSEGLNLLGPSGRVQACNGIALPSHITDTFMFFYVGRPNVQLTLFPLYCTLGRIHMARKFTDVANYSTESLLQNMKFETVFVELPSFSNITYI
jgi:hypothetical protein